MSDKPKFPRAAALDVAREICAALKPVTRRLIVAGSLRRRKEEVGDVEILFVPEHWDVGEKTIFTQHDTKTEDTIEKLEMRGILDRRKTVKGSETFGPKNKLMVHRASSIPVDLFTASEANWWNYLVCRTGGALSNVAVATRAREQGYKWNPYGEGYTRLKDGSIIPMRSEQEVFEFIGLRYLQPWERK